MVVVVVVVGGGDGSGCHVVARSDLNFNSYVQVCLSLRKNTRASECTLIVFFAGHHSCVYLMFRLWFPGGGRAHRGGQAGGQRHADRVPACRAAAVGERIPTARACGACDCVQVRCRKKILTCPLFRTSVLRTTMSAGFMTVCTV